MSFGYSIQEVKTPAYALDLPVFKVGIKHFYYSKKNCEDMVNKAKSMGLKLRVHVKVSFLPISLNRLIKQQKVVVSS